MMIFPPIPRDTLRAATAVFGRNNFYLFTGDHLNRLFEGLEPSVDRSQAILYLLTIFQYIEALPDHLVPGALHERLDWKYALHLPLKYGHLDAVDLCEIRRQLGSDSLQRAYFQALILRLSTGAQGAGSLLQNQSAPRLIARVCLFSRVAKTWEAINRALEALAIQEPEWLLDHSLPHWYERYDPSHKNLNLNVAEKELLSSAQTIGQDGAHILKAIAAARSPALLAIPEVVQLEWIWQEQYKQEKSNLTWRPSACKGCLLSGTQDSFIYQ